MKKTFLKFWSAIDGKKLITGILIAIMTGGVQALRVSQPKLMAIFPITDDMITVAAGTAATFIVGGAVHKVVKNKKAVK